LLKVRNGARLAITLVALLAFALQTLVLQTHIHGVPLAGTVGVSLAVEKGQQPAPPANDPANCPICQEMLHAGAFVAPGAATLQIATLASVIDFLFVEIFATAQTRSHGWKSRAPPRA
jgi:hypothetical protein